MAFSAAASLLLVSSALATPLVLRQDAPDITTDKSQICGHNPPNTNEEAVALWKKTNAGYYLEVYVEEVAKMDLYEWVDNMWNWVYPQNGAFAETRDCNTLGSGCTMDLNCSSFIDANRGGYYWVMMAVQGLHNQYSHAKDMLQDSVIDGALSLTTITDDFAQPPPDSGNPSAYMAAALTMGAGGVASFAGIDPVAAGSLTVFAGLFSGLSTQSKDNNHDDVDTSSMATALGDMFKSAREQLQGTLDLATGHTPDGDYSLLPTYGANDWKSPVANFFDSGKFLMSADSLDDAFNAGMSNMKHKLLDIAIQSVGYKVMGSWSNKENDCTGTGRVWAADIDEGRCFSLVKIPGNLANPGVKPEDGSEGNYGCGTGINHCDIFNMSDDEYNKLIDFYKMDLEAYYRAAYDCAVTGNGEVDQANLPLDESVPTCFFNPRTFVGKKFNNQLTEWEEFE